MGLKQNKYVKIVIEMAAAVLCEKITYLKFRSIDRLIFFLDKNSTKR